MVSEIIEHIRLDAESRLFVRPRERHFEHVYRAGTAVTWQASKQELYIRKPHQLQALDAFELIRRAVVSEYAVRIVFDDETVWQNIPEQIITGLKTA